MDNKNNDKYTAITMTERTPSVKQTKPKFNRVLSVTENYHDSVMKNNLICGNMLMRAVSKNDFEQCKFLLENEYKDLSQSTDDYYFHPLLLAAQKNCLDILKLLLEHGANINVQDRKNCSALHFAIQQRNLECCRLLLSKNINITVKDKDGNFPIHVAASEGLKEIVDSLLEKHPDPNVTNKKIQTPLQLACIKGKNDIVDFLLSKGARWDLKDINYWYPIHCAAFYGHHNCCSTLMNICSNQREKVLDWRNKDKATPLVLAAKKGHSRCCQVLKDSKINVIAHNGNTALHYATSAGFVKTIEVLLEMEPDATIRNSDGNTAIHKAAAQDNGECLKMLVNYLNEDPGRNNAHQSVIHLAALNNCQEALTFLLEQPTYQSQINIQDVVGKTALHLALKQSNEQSAEILISAGADCTIADNKGNLPLHVAAAEGLFTTCKLLLTGNKVQNVKDRTLLGTSALHLSAMKGSFDCCKLLLNKGADLTANDSNGFSPFHVAANEGHLDVITLFTKKGGGYINRYVEISGDTPLHLAARGGHLECCDFILRNMKKDFTIKTNNNDCSALDESFLNDKDTTFELILSKLSFPKEDKHQAELYYPFESSLHEYMHKALESGREIIQKSIVESQWWYSAFDSRFCNKEPCQNLNALTEINPRLSSVIYDKCINKHSEFTLYNFQLFNDTHYVPLDSSADLENIFRQRESAFDCGTFRLRKEAVPFKSSREHPLIVAANNELLNLMQHPLTEAFLQYKWMKYMRYILAFLVFNEVLFVTFLGLYLLSIWNYKMLEKSNISVSDLCYSLNKTDLAFLNSTLPNDVIWIRTGFLYVTLLFMTVTLCGSQIYYIIKGRFQITKANIYNFSIITMIRIFRIVGLICLLMPLNLCLYDILIKETWKWQIGILTLLVSWFNMIHSLNEIPALNVFMPVTHQFGRSFIRVLFYILLIMFIFSFIFHLLLKDKMAFSSISIAFIKTVVWVLGDLGYDDTFLDDKDPILYPFLTNLVFLLLVTSISGFLVNLAISQPSDYIDLFRQKAIYHQISSRINFFLKLDVVFDFANKKHLVSFYKVKNRSAIATLMAGIGSKTNQKNRVNIPREAVSSIGNDDSGQTTENAQLLTILERLERIEAQLTTMNKK